MGAPRWPPNPPTLGAPRRSRGAPRPRSAPRARRSRRRSAFGAGVGGGDVGPGGVAEQTREDGLEVGERYADLLHRVALADRHPLIPGLALLALAHRLDVDRAAVGRAALVLPPVEAPDGRGVVVHGRPPAGQPRTKLVSGGHDLGPLLE